MSPFRIWHILNSLKDYFYCCIFNVMRNHPCSHETDREALAHLLQFQGRRKDAKKKFIEILGDPGG